MAIENKSIFLANVDFLRKQNGWSKSDLNRLIFGEYSDKRPKNTLWRSDQLTINLEVAKKTAKILNTSVEKLLKDRKAVKSYPEVEEQMLPRDDQRIPSAMSYSIDKDAFKDRKVDRVIFEVPLEYAKLIADLNRILNKSEYYKILKDTVWILSSGETPTITALELNVSQFAEKIKERIRDREEREENKKIIRKLEKQVDQLTKQLKIEKNAGDSSPNPGSTAENE